MQTLIFRKTCVAASLAGAGLPVAVASEGGALPVMTGFAAMAQTFIGLLSVIGLIFVCAWIARRLGMRASLRQERVIKVVGGAALTQREKVIVVEVAGVWLVLGVAPGSVRTLHTLPATPAHKD